MNKLGAVIKKIIFRMKLRRMDDMYYFLGGSCFSMFPPSFYLTHTPEEVEEITNREIENLRQMLEEMKAAEEETNTDTLKEIPASDTSIKWHKIGIADADDMEK